MEGKKIKFCGHAEDKFEILERHGFTITREQVEDSVKSPDIVTEGSKNRKVYQKTISETHLVRTICEEGEEFVEVVTFYPGRRERYENEI